MSLKVQVNLLIQVQGLQPCKCGQAAFARLFMMPLHLLNAFKGLRIATCICHVQHVHQPRPLIQ